MILAQAVLQIFCLQIYSTKVEKASKKDTCITKTTNPTEKKTIRVRLFLIHIPYIKLQGTISNRQTHRRACLNQYVSSTFSKFEA